MNEYRNIVLPHEKLKKTAPPFSAMVLFLVEKEELELLVEKEQEDFKKKLEKKIVEELKDANIEAGADFAIKQKQEQDWAFESTHYNFDIASVYFDEGAETNTFYYDLGIKPRENSEKAGVSYDSYTSEHESAVLKQGQRLQQDAKAAHQQHKIHVTIDSREKEARDSIRLFSPATWQWMYSVSGKIEFN